MYYPVRFVQRICSIMVSTDEAASQLSISQIPRSRIRYLAFEQEHVGRFAEGSGEKSLLEP